jgi:hypothetical protein
VQFWLCPAICMTSPRIYGVRIFIPSSSLLAFSTKNLRGCGCRGARSSPPKEFNADDVPVLEFSLIDSTLVKADEGAIADMISRAWTNFHLKTEGWFVLRLRQDGNHQIEFPE